MAMCVCGSTCRDGCASERYGALGTLTPPLPPSCPSPLLPPSCSSPALPSLPPAPPLPPASSAPPSYPFLLPLPPAPSLFLTLRSMTFTKPSPLQRNSLCMTRVTSSTRPASAGSEVRCLMSLPHLKQRIYIVVTKAIDMVFAVIRLTFSPRACRDPVLCVPVCVWEGVCCCLEASASGD